MRGRPPTLIDVFGRSSGRPPVSDATSLLFDLPGFRVVSVEVTPLGVRRVVVMQVAAEHACPRCGVLAGGKPYDVREMRVKDLPVGHRPLLVVWRKRRYRCREVSCPQRVFTERSEQLPPRHRLTRRLRERLEHAASRSARALSDVAAEYGVSWWSVHHALLVTALDRTGEVPAVRMLGLDETRARSLRWSWEGQRWQLSNPWMTSFVDLDTGRPGWLLGLAVCPRPALARAGRGGRARPVGAVRGRGPPAAAAGHRGGRPLASGPARQPDGHRGPATGDPRTAGPARPQDRPRLGAPTAAAGRRQPTGPARAGPAARRLRRRPDPGTGRSLGNQRAAAAAAGRPVRARRPAPAESLLRGRPRRRHARADPARRHHLHLVARNRSAPAAAGHQPPHRRRELRYQATQAGRLRLQKSRQLQRRILLHIAAKNAA